MADRENLEVGNNTVYADAEFTAGYGNGSLSYYDTNYQLPRPLTSEAVYLFMMNNLSDEQATSRWNAGFVFGWITALCENKPEYFFASQVIPEPPHNTEPLLKPLQEAQENVA